MKRSGPLKRSTPLQRGSGLAPVSKRQRQRNAAYSVVRAVVLERDGHACQRCGTGMDLHTHHRAGRTGDRMADASLLVTLCGGCHAAVHASPSESYAAGWLLRRVA